MAKEIKAKEEYRLERIVKGFANHRRIEILALLSRQPELSVAEITEFLKINFKTASGHIQKLAMAGLVMKRSDTISIRHRLTARGEKILKFLTSLD